MTPRKTKLKAFLEMLDDNVSKTEFVSSFKSIIDSIKKFETKLATDFKALSATMDKKIASMRDGKDGKDGVDGNTPVKGVDYFDGEDGEDADPESITQQVLERIPKIDLTPLWDEINKLKEPKEVEDRPYDQTVSKGVTVYGPGKTRIILTDLSNLLDGSTKTFTLPTNFGIVSVQSSSTPFAFRQGIDYNAVGKTIVFTAGIDAPSMLAAGQTLIISTIR